MKLKPSNNKLLTVQYRMHPKISEFISNAFYDSKITNGVNENQRTKVNFNNKFNWPKKISRLFSSMLKEKIKFLLRVLHILTKWNALLYCI
jgi:superfamily I DNA and/or RNA helicase